MDERTDFGTILMQRTHNQRTHKFLVSKWNF